MLDSLILRKAHIKDIEGIMEVEAESFTKPWTYDALKMELSKNFLAEYLVVDYDGEVIAFGGVWLIYDEGHITNIAVKKDFRGLGLGKLIVAGLVKICFDRDINMMTLEVRKSNKRAQNLYSQFGFKIEGVRKGYYKDDGEDAYIMNKYRKV